MTYFQLLKTCLEFAIEIPVSEEFKKYWGWESWKHIPTFEELKADSKRKLSYLQLKMLSEHTQLSERYLKLLSYLEDSLAEKVPMISNIPSEEVEELNNQVMDNLSSLDELFTITDFEQLDLEIERKYKEIYDQELMKKAYDYAEVISSAIGNIYYDAIVLLPELFFGNTEKKFLPPEYDIADENLKKKCLDYVRDRVYFFHDNFVEKELSVDNTETFFYTVRLINIVIELIRANQLAKLEKMMALDECFSDIVDWNDSLVNQLYNPSLVKQINLLDTAFISIEKEKYLNFFLSEDPTISNLTPTQLATILVVYFNSLEPDDQVNSLKRDISQIMPIIDNKDSIYVKNKQIVLIKEKNSNQ